MTFFAFAVRLTPPAGIPLPPPKTPRASLLAAGTNLPSNTDPTMPATLHNHLPVRFTPLPDETISSWLVRLAAAYALKTRSLVSLLSGEEAEFNYDLDGPKGEKTLALLARHTGLDPDRLRLEHTLTGFQKYLCPHASPGRSSPWLLPLGPAKAPRPSMQFCPACLDAPIPYLRRTWRSSLLTVCPQHRVELCHDCPACAAPLIPIRSDRRWGKASVVVCWRCGGDMRKAPTSPVPEEDARLAAEYLRALWEGTPLSACPAHLTAADYFTGLSIVCARLLSRAPRLSRWRELVTEGARIDRLPSAPQRHSRTAFDSIVASGERRRVLRAADWLLGAWPQRFLETAQAAGTRTSDFLCFFSAAPRWFVEPLQTHLTPPRRKPTLTPGMVRVQRMKEVLLAHRREWGPVKLPQLVRTLRAAGFYHPDSQDRYILCALTNMIARIRRDEAGGRRRLTQQVPRGTPEWTRLLLLAIAYRKEQCQNPAILRRGIRLLCEGRYLSAFDLGELLHRNHAGLSARYLVPMVRAGELETRLEKNRGGNSGLPGQAYRSTGSQPLGDHLPISGRPPTARA